MNETTNENEEVSDLDALITGIEQEEKERDDLDRAEIARLISEGNTSGILDSEEYRISWELKITKFLS